MTVIDIVITCEEVPEHPHGCEDNVMFEVTEGVMVTERGIKIDTFIPFEEGWAVERERDCLRLRCPQHAPDPPALDESEVEFETRGSYVYATHKPTGLKEGQYGEDAKARRLAVKKLAYAVARHEP